jgi:hypothetical protein
MSETQQSCTPVPSGNTVYTYDFFANEFARNDDLWENFQYLPRAQQLQFSAAYDNTNTEPIVLNGSLEKQLCVGTCPEVARFGGIWNAPVVIRKHKIYADGHKSSKVSLPELNRVSFFLRSGEKIHPDEHNCIDFDWPFNAAARANVRFLVLLYFLEKGLLKSFAEWSTKPTPFATMCKNIAHDAASEKDFTPVRKKRDMTIYSSQVEAGDTSITANIEANKDNSSTPSRPSLQTSPSATGKATSDEELISHTNGDAQSKCAAQASRVNKPSPLKRIAPTSVHPTATGKSPQTNARLKMK